MKANRLGQAVRLHREQCKLSPTELANRLAVSSTVVRRIEAGVTLPRRGLIAKLEDSLNLPSGTLAALVAQDQAEAEAAERQAAGQRAASVVAEMPQDVRLQLGHVLRRNRELQGLGQALVGRACGLSARYVAAFERGEHYPADGWLERLAACLRLPLPWLQELRDQGRAAAGRAKRVPPALSTGGAGLGLMWALLLLAVACKRIDPPMAPAAAGPHPFPCAASAAHASAALSREQRMKADKEREEDCSVQARYGRSIHVTLSGRVER